MDTGLLLYFVSLVAYAGIFSVLALGLNVQWGFTGLFNAGIAGFFAVGAYTSAILTTDPTPARVGGFGLPVPLGWLAAMVTAGLVAWAIGRICLKLRSDYLAIGTIGIAEIIRLILKNEGWLTNGTRGINGLPRPFDSYPPEVSQIAFMLLVIGVVAVIYIALELQINAPWGRMMRAIREREVAAAAMGKDVAKRRLEAFILGAVIMGLGGAMQAHYTKFIGPESSDPMIATFLVWVMLILGGSGNNRGAILGAVVVWTIWSTTEIFTQRLPTELAVKAAYIRVFLIGLLLQFVLILRPEGILPEPDRKTGKSVFAAPAAPPGDPGRP